MKLYRTAFDLDDTLIECTIPLEEFFKKFGIKWVEPRKTFTFKFIDDKGKRIDTPWMCHVFYSFFMNIDSKPIDEHTYEFLKKVFNRSPMPIKLITSRHKFKGILERTKEQLALVFPGICFTISHGITWSKKSDELKTGEFEVFFEDRRRTARDLSSKEYIVFMRKTFYNKLKESDNAIDVKDLDISNIKKGTIIRYNNFKELLDLNVYSILR